MCAREKTVFQYFVCVNMSMSTCNPRSIFKFASAKLGTFIYGF